MAIPTRRWNDPPGSAEGRRLLVSRYRPRGVRKEDETWDEWWKHLGPSVELHADFYGKHGPPIDWPTYRQRYLTEMKHQRDAIGALAERLARGESFALLCSSHCVDATHCHRTLLARLIEAELERQAKRR